MSLINLKELEALAEKVQGMAPIKKEEREVIVLCFPSLIKAYRIAREGLEKYKAEDIRENQNGWANLALSQLDKIVGGE